MISIAVQAGGRSRRMGQDKALIPLDGRRLIEHVIECLQGLSDDLFITSNHPPTLNDLNIRLVPDKYPGRGALFGLGTALQAARHNDVLVVACDMPFIQPIFIKFMLSKSGQADIIVPELDGHLEPLLAVYHRNTCLPAIEQAIQDQKLRMISFFPAVSVSTIDTETIDRLDPGRLSFFNINTPDDVKVAERILQVRRLDKKSDAQSTPIQTKSLKTEQDNAP